jgi:hypothetical protein
MNFMQAWAVSFLFALFLVLFWTFLTAYFSPAKATTIWINTGGEADLELILLSGVFVFCIYAFLYLPKKELIKNGRNKNSAKTIR